MCRGKLRTQSTARTLGQKDTANQKSRFGPPGRNPQSMIASKPTQKWGSEREGLNNLVNILSLSFFFFFSVSLAQVLVLVQTHRWESSTFS